MDLRGCPGDHAPAPPCRFGTAAHRGRDHQGTGVSGALAGLAIRGASQDLDVATSAPGQYRSSLFGEAIEPGAVREIGCGRVRQVRGASRPGDHRLERQAGCGRTGGPDDFESGVESIIRLRPAGGASGTPTGGSPVAGAAGSEVVLRAARALGRGTATADLLPRSSRRWIDRGCPPYGHAVGAASRSRGLLRPAIALGRTVRGRRSLMESAVPGPMIPAQTCRDHGAGVRSK